MIKKLRFKFILIAMISVIAVLSIIMIAVNAMNYIEVAKDGDHLIDLLSRYGGFERFEEEPDGDKTNPPSNLTIPQSGINQNPFGMNAETPFDTRYFIVTFQADGSTIVDTDKIAAIEQEEALSIANTVLNYRDKSGYYEIYRYRVVENNGVKKLYFVDCQKQLDTSSSFLIYSILISIIGSGCVFILVFIFSTRIIRPIAESYERQKRFITNAGHELKTPLTVISANNEITEMQIGETESTQAIAKQVSKMTTMVKNLTALAKLDEKNSLEDASVFSLSDALIDVTNSFSSYFTVNKKEFLTDIEDNIHFRGQENLIRQLFYIVLDNAAKYSLTKAEISLHQSSKIVFEISNDADNIEPGNMNKCFERFYRSNTVRGSEVEGSGIGLSVAQEIVLLHKGVISAYGTTDGRFIIKIVF